MASIARFLLEFALSFRSTPLIVDVCGCKTQLKSLLGLLLMIVVVKQDNIDKLSTLFFIWIFFKTTALKGKNTMSFEATGLKIGKKKICLCHAFKYGRFPDIKWRAWINLIICSMGIIFKSNCLRWIIYESLWSRMSLFLFRIFTIKGVVIC